MATAQIDKAKFVELLQVLCSPDNAARKRAEVLYQQAKVAEPDKTIVGVMVVLGTSEVDDAARAHAAVLLRQMVMRGPAKDFVFAKLSAQHQLEVAAELLRLFEQEHKPKLQKKIGEVVSKLAEHVCDQEDPRGSLVPGTCGWPGLLPVVLRMANASVASSADCCEVALHLLKELIGSLLEDILGAKAELESIIQHALMHVNLKLKTAGLLLVCEIVSSSEKKAWAPLLVTAGILVQVVRQLAAAAEEELLKMALQTLIDTATAEPDFFRDQMRQNMEPAKVVSEIARNDIDEGIRSLALEWLVVYLERKTKWLRKNVCDFAPLVLQCCMQFMTEMEDGQDAVKAWAARMDDEEGEEDFDKFFHIGEETIDRLVKAMEIEGVGPALYNVITHYSAQDSWQAKHAALAAIKQTVEYVEDKNHVDVMANILLRHLDHPHPRVRFMSLHALGQLANDQAPFFQEAKHSTVMPMLLKMMDDNVDRVAAMSMSAFTAFGEELDTSLMLQYSHTFMEKLCAKLQGTKHRGVREESITSVAVIAGVIEKDFSKYYDSIMPVLKQLVMHATSEKESRLRGKSFECMSLLGLAVGKEKFLPDAREAITEMLKTPLQADVYIKEALERICQCLKKDFAFFLPNLLDGIFKGLELGEAEDERPGLPELEEEQEEEHYIPVSTADGEVLQVRSSRFQELLQSEQLLNTFMTEMEGAYFDWVQPTATVMLPLLSVADDASYLCDEVRGLALHNWALLIKAARAGAEERAVPMNLAGELFRTGLHQTFTLLQNNLDPEMLSGTVSGITECVKSVGLGVFTAEEIAALVTQIFALMDQSFERSRCSSRRGKQKSADDEDEDVWEDSGEGRLRQCYEETIGALMAAAPAHFLQCLPACVERIRSWLGTSENKLLALYLSCSLLENLKEHSEPAWPVFMPEVFQLLGDTDADLRAAAAYAINVAAPLDGFAEAAPEAFRRLAEVVQRTHPGRTKKEAKSRMALDNAVGALLALAKEKPSHCPAAVQAWSLVISRLPLRDDVDEAKKVHEKIVDLLLEDHQGLLGGPTRPNLGQLLGILAEVYRVESICKRTNEPKILQVFRSLPVDVLKGFAQGFTEKQQKKIEKMLTGLS